jgi:hypothetical protein
MFTPDQLRDRIHDLMKLRHTVPIEAATFDAEQFQSPASEQQIVIHRAKPADTDPMLFWVCSVAKLDWWKGRGGEGSRTKFLRESLCRQLTEAQFDAIVAEHSGGLTPPIRLPLHRGGAFRSAMEMAKEWGLVAAIAAWDDELLGFYWSTSA